MTNRLAVPSVLLIACGGLLLLAAALWGRFKDPRDYWDDSQAKELANAGSIHHAVACALGEGEGKARDEQLLAAFEESKQEYEQTKIAFNQARERFERPLRMMRWSGTACLVVGILAYWLARGSEGA